MGDGWEEEEEEGGAWKEARVLTQEVVDFASPLTLPKPPCPLKPWAALTAHQFCRGRLLPTTARVK